MAQNDQGGVMTRFLIVLASCAALSACAAQEGPEPLSSLLTFDEISAEISVQHEVLAQEAESVASIAAN